MAYLFLLLVTLFALLSWIYLVSNDFAPETLEVIFPAVGAILLSLYLGYKSVAIDRPPAHQFGGTLAVLHDHRTGDVISPHRLAARYLDLSTLSAHFHVDSIPHYNAFRALDLRKRLQTPSTEPLGEPRESLQHIVEYALLEWLSRMEQQIGYSRGPSIRLIGSSGGGGGIPAGAVAMSTSLGKGDYNPLVAAAPVSISLPPGAAVQRSRSAFPQIRITTRHSELTIKIDSVAGGQLSPPFGRETERIHSALGIQGNPAPLSMYGYAVVFSFRTKPFRRFSDQAKVERSWATGLEENFERDFDWDYLRERILAARV